MEEDCTQHFYCSYSYCLGRRRRVSEVCDGAPRTLDRTLDRTLIEVRRGITQRFDELDDDELVSLNYSIQRR